MNKIPLFDKEKFDVQVAELRQKESSVTKLQEVELFVESIEMILNQLKNILKEN